MYKVFVCEEHTDIGIEKVLDLNKLPIVEETEQSHRCELCDQLSRYIVKSGDDFEG
ncbi:CxxH/CxxC protein [Haloplasma contractile]|uniref:YyzF-like protein n=1 Tax=Haloplasma contractile SSD-17B TaxID=1033810 RepID=F7PT62_9MOLU|nr:CxxH/CxxC protein [Haloplasma contractile]ERJ12523.1 YyzF-like protein [Haloplasma contractile SSD-17B]